MQKSIKILSIFFLILTIVLAIFIYKNKYKNNRFFNPKIILKNLN